MIGYFVIVLALGLLGTVHCQGKFVDVQSTCGTSCTGGASDPFLTISDGLKAIPSGGALIIRDGVYKGVGNLNLSISSAAVSISSVNGPASTIIDCEYNGFGFDLFSGPFTITGLTVRNCIRTNFDNNNYGGGAFSIHSTYTQLVDMVLVNNGAVGLGGAVSNSAVMRNTTVTNNNVTGIGGGVYVQSADLQISNFSRVTGNKASINASDLFCTSASVEINDSNSHVGSVVCAGCTVTQNNKNICPSSATVSAASLTLTLSALVLCLVNLYI